MSVWVLTDILWERRCFRRPDETEPTPDVPNVFMGAADAGASCKHLFEGITHFYNSIYIYKSLTSVEVCKIGWLLCPLGKVPNHLLTYLLESSKWYSNLPLVFSIIVFYLATVVYHLLKMVLFKNFPNPESCSYNE